MKASVQNNNNQVGFLKTSFIAATAVLMLSVPAIAKERFLVIYKSSQGYKAMNNYMNSEAASPSVKLEDSLSYINGMVLSSKNSAQIENLKNHPEVAVVEREIFRELPKPVNGFRPALAFQTQQDDQSGVVNDSASLTVPVLKENYATPWGIIAVNAGAAWDKSQAGANARVLVLDTGIDPQHPSLKANFEQGRNFFESDAGPNPEDFLDKEGHGTHCAGTIAGVYNDQTGFTGVAPLAKILMGRVCGDLGCSNIAVAQGINWGIKQKVDVISMSLGGPRTSSAEQMAVANAEAAGVVVVAASGNSAGDQGYSSDKSKCSKMQNCGVSYPAALPNVIAVGAVDSTLTRTVFSQFGPELSIVAPGAAVVSTVPRGTGRDSIVEITLNGQATKVRSSAFAGTKLFTSPKVGELVVAGLGKPEDFAKVNVAGKIALVRRGEIKFSDKVANAIAAKAIGVVIYNNTAGLMQGSITEDGSELNVAVVMIEKTVGESLVEKMSAGQSAAASVITSASDYAMFDGTSMATPHVAGVAALIKSANKKLTPAQVRQIIKQTAVPLSPNSNNEYGAGMIQADKAVQMAVGL